MANPTQLSLPTLLGTCGMRGPAACDALTEIASMQPGETRGMPAVAGSAGSIAGQIGKLHGARLVSIAGGAETGRRSLIDTLGGDAAGRRRSTGGSRSRPSGPTACT